MHTCHNCKVGKMREPKDKHPSYYVCDSCMAMELRYTPQEYQEEMHSYSNGVDKLDILAIFGGKKSHSRR